MVSTTPHSIWVWMIKMVVSMLMIAMHCHGCWEEERIALLHLKTSINYPNGNLLPSWVDNKSSNCCQWEKVECSHISNRVIQLSLNHARSWILGDWYFNAYLFLPFKEIKTLELSNNALAGWAKNEGFERLSELINLEVLDLSWNNFNSCIILESVSEISSLKSLNLGSNWLGNVHLTSFERLSELINLEVLDLSGNNFSNNIILEFVGRISSLKFLYLQDNQLGSSINLTSFKKLSTLTNLKVLNLSFNKINNSKILEYMGEILSLKCLYFSGNGLGSLVDLTSLCELKTLQEIELSYNGLGGELPRCLANLTSLRFLDISNNQFTGNIALSPLANLISLEYLILSNNNFLVPISFKSYYNHSKLTFLESVNNIFLEEKDFLGLAPSFQLIQIHLCGSERDRNASVSLPNFFYYQNQIQVVHLSGFNFGRTSPAWLLENNTRLQAFILTENSFFEHFQLPSYPMTQLEELDISNNNFYGAIPYKIDSFFPMLKSLNLSHNNLTGGIPTTFSKIKNIESLDLSHNNLNGNIPSQLTDLYLLEIFNVSYNNLSGRIPQAANQFETFDSSSYIENPFLCGEPLRNNCTDSPPSVLSSNNNASAVSNFIDVDTFYMSFTGSGTVALLATAGILYINPRWRQAWFHVTQVFITSSYYFVVDNIWRIKVGFLCRYV